MTAIPLQIAASPARRSPWAPSARSNSCPPSSSASTTECSPTAPTAVPSPWPPRSRSPFLLSIALLDHVRPAPSARDAGAPPLREFAEGARYVARRPDLLGTCLADLAATVFALSTALFPFPAEESAAPWALGLLYSASAAGSLLHSASAAGSLVAAATGG
ncbi:hypothetical protein ABZX88_16770 [Kitasatospora aureofaciens]|uniref:hypothetical protein n=1 Tax=Kitasatospora aureofaciens TaxID=1894 RepID=UPI0033B10FB2